MAIKYKTTIEKWIKEYCKCSLNILSRLNLEIGLQRKEAETELLKKVRKDFKNVAVINIDKYIDGELEKLSLN